MDAIANWIAKNPYFTAAGLFATFLGLIIAIIVPIIQRRRKQLYYTTSTTLKIYKYFFAANKSINFLLQT